MKANIPPLAQFNPKVPPDLEKVLHRALARNVDDRYRSARDFGKDLLDFLYHHGHPVGAFAVEALVRDTMQARQREKPVAASIIDKLIEEALFEFTSLRSSDSPPEPGTQAKVPGVHDWASEIKIKGPYDSRHALSSLSESFSSGSMLEEGNLAALEDDPSAPPESPRDEPSQPPPASSAPPPARQPSAAPVRAQSRPAPSPVHAPSPPPAAALALPPEDARKSSGLTYVIIVVLVIAAGAAGAWFANVIPH